METRFQAADNIGQPVEGSEGTGKLQGGYNMYKLQM